MDSTDRQSEETDNDRTEREEAEADVYVALLDYTDEDTPTLSTEEVARHADLEMELAQEILDNYTDIGMVEEREGEYRPLIRFEQASDRAEEDVTADGGVTEDDS